MKVVIDERWGLEQEFAHDTWRTPKIRVRDGHSYSRVITRETDEFMFDFLENLIDNHFVED